MSASDYKTGLDFRRSGPDGFDTCCCTNYSELTFKTVQLAHDPQVQNMTIIMISTFYYTKPPRPGKTAEVTCNLLAPGGKQLQCEDILKIAAFQPMMTRHQYLAWSQVMQGQSVPFRVI